MTGVQTCALPISASVAYNTTVGAFIIPVCLAVNLVLLLLGCTRTINIDLWNYWHFAFIGAVIYFAIDYKNTVFAELGGTIHDENSAIYGMRWLNEKTSVIYFNFYTILIAISIAAFTGYISGLFRGQKEKELEI